MTIKENDLIVATQGRAFYVLDDLSMLQQKDESVLHKKLHLFTVNDSWRMEGSRNKAVHNAGLNPPNGAVIHYFAKGANGFF